MQTLLAVLRRVGTVQRLLPHWQLRPKWSCGALGAKLGQTKLGNFEKGFRFNPTNGGSAGRDGTDGRRVRTCGNRSGPVIAGRFGTEGSVVQIHSPRPLLMGGFAPAHPPTRSLVRLGSSQKRLAKSHSVRVRAR